MEKDQELEELDQKLSQILEYKIRMLEKQDKIDPLIVEVMEELVTTPVITGTPPDSYSEEKRELIKEVQELVLET